jgi:uncharacterized protein YodC (DUF2158 family)
MAMADDLKVGDAVVLKKARPQMFVTSVDEKSVAVTWYDKAKEEQQSGSVPKALLMKAPRQLRKRRLSYQAS